MKFEYEVNNVQTTTQKTALELKNHLNKAGEDGWEVVTLSTGKVDYSTTVYFVVLKRPVPDPVP
jgi:hypothetical protein